MNHRLWLAPELPPVLGDALAVFETHASTLASSELRTVEDVRSVVAHDLRRHGWVVAEGPRSVGGIALPTSVGWVIRADAHHPRHRAALWIETGRSWMNNAFLADTVEASLSPQVDHVLVALRNEYQGSPAWSRAVEFLDAVVVSGRVQLPLASLLVIGY